MWGGTEQACVRGRRGGRGGPGSGTEWKPERKGRGSEWEAEGREGWWWAIGFVQLGQRVNNCEVSANKRKLGVFGSAPLHTYNPLRPRYTRHPTHAPPPIRKAVYVASLPSPPSLHPFLAPRSISDPCGLPTLSSIPASSDAPCGDNSPPRPHTWLDAPPYTTRRRPHALRPTVRMAFRLSLLRAAENTFEVTAGPLGTTRGSGHSGKKKPAG